MEHVKIKILNSIKRKYAEDHSYTFYKYRHAHNLLKSICQMRDSSRIDTWRIWFYLWFFLFIFIFLPEISLIRLQSPRPFHCFVLFLVNTCLFSLILNYYHFSHYLVCLCFDHFTHMKIFSFWLSYGSSFTFQPWCIWLYLDPMDYWVALPF